MRDASAKPDEGQRPFLRAGWHDLVLLNYEVDPAILQPRVPAGTELDEWRGRHYVSLVGFRFTRVRVLGCAVPFHTSFPEVNLRFYVRRRAGNEWRRGVVFVREVVPRRAVTWVARTLYGEPYITCPMRVEQTDGPDGRWHRYAWRYRDRWQTIGARVEGAASPLVDGSEAEFITEHYWGYTRQRQRDGREAATLEYRVAHPRWQVWNAREWQCEIDVSAMYGEDFVSFLQGEPRSVFVADGSPIEVHAGVRV